MQIKPDVLFENCYGRYAIPAVNVFFMEEVLALFAAGQEARAPFIVQTTPFARDYAHAGMLLAMIGAAARLYPRAVYAVHLDHGNESHILDALDTGGYASVMIDASHDSFETNAARTRAVVEKAHAKGVNVEAELGVLAGVEDDLVVEGRGKYTDPDEAAAFVALTGCDSLAVAIGTSHGAYKFAGAQGLQMEVLRAIAERLPGFPLVLHGGSNVDPEVIRRINAAGGRLKEESRGVGNDEIRQAILLGICKINIATDMRLLWTMINREFFRDHPDEFAPTTPGRAYQEAYRRFIVNKMALFGASGRAQEFES